MRTLYMAGFRVFGRALTTTPVFGPSVLPFPPRLSLSLIFLPRPPVATSPPHSGDPARPDHRWGLAPLSAEARTISEGGGGIKEHRHGKDYVHLSRREKRPELGARTFFQSNRVTRGGDRQPSSQTEYSPRIRPTWRTFRPPCLRGR